MTIQNPIGPQPQYYPNTNYTWGTPRRVTKKIVTEVMEYDEGGRLVKKTVTTEEVFSDNTSTYVTWNV